MVHFSLTTVAAVCYVPMCTDFISDADLIMVLFSSGVWQIFISTTHLSNLASKMPYSYSMMWFNEVSPNFSWWSTRRYIFCLSHAHSQYKHISSSWCCIAALKEQQRHLRCCHWPCVFLRKKNRQILQDNTIIGKSCIILQEPYRACLHNIVHRCRRKFCKVRLSSLATFRNWYKLHVTIRLTYW